MKKLHYEILIDAPKEKFWNNIIEDDPFRKWTSEFAYGSYFEGSWEKGSEIKFLMKDKSGNTEGMISEIAENKPYEFLSIKHRGIVKDGVVDTESDEVKKWAPAFENYTFSQNSGKTLFKVDMDVDESMEEMFTETWPKALKKLKEISEGSVRL